MRPNPNKRGGPAQGCPGTVQSVPTDELRTARLVLRDLTAEDFDAIHAYASDPEVCRFMVWGPNSPDETRVYLEEQLGALSTADRTVYNKAVVHAGAVIGCVELRILDRQRGRAEFGYVFQRQHWGQGYATEAAQALVGFGFEGLGLKRIEATCDPENHASARVLQKVGLTLEGRLPRHVKVRGGWRDRLQFAQRAMERPG
jgi:[ribosomal protein S5]-alanine N-acetyltransferase